MKKIIINADDFGLTEQCTYAIIDAFDNHLITDTTMVANGEALNIVKKSIIHNDNILKNIGIHFNLTEGEPVTDAIKNLDFIVHNGKFTRYLATPQNYFRPFTKKEKQIIYEELEMQLFILRELGIQPTHADSHQHIHYNWQVAGIVVALCKKHEIKKIRIHKNVQDKGPVKNFMFSMYNRWLLKQGFVTTDHFGNIKEYQYIKEGISELMVHPDYNNKGELIDRERRKFGTNKYEAIGELLKHNLAHINSINMELISYSRL